MGCCCFNRFLIDVGRNLSVWNLHVLPVILCWFLSGSSRFLPQPKYVHISLSGDVTLLLGASVFVSVSVLQWTGDLSQCLPFHLMIGPTTLESISSSETRWKNECLIEWVAFTSADRTWCNIWNPNCCVQSIYHLFLTLQYLPHTFIAVWYDLLLEGWGAVRDCCLTGNDEAL